MGTIYITGHKNPDLDSVCSAYAYAKLMNLQDPDNTYIPVRCGHLSDSTRSILDQLDTDIPQYMRDVYPKVGDVMLQSDSFCCCSFSGIYVCHYSYISCSF